MAVQIVFSSNLDPSNPNLTNRFTGATGFYIDAPLSATEIEIDCFLQVYFPTANVERVRVINLGKLKEGEIRQNETDTESLVTIPAEYIDSGLEMAILFLASEPVFLDVYVITPDCNLCQIAGRLDVIEETLSAIFEALNDGGVPVDPGGGDTGDGDNTNGIDPVGQDASLENFFIFI